ncbi:hypothetical protein LCGC14_1819420 [marine sediment metagenome]|uniref:Uncharacterized protein n=1 Tax=marine sediment metagenome TaxID=412755 RepID=A0A0F9JIY6_9ZZZZ
MTTKRIISLALLVFVAWATNAWADHLRIVFTRGEGSVSIVGPAPEFVARFPTEADALAAILAMDVPANAIDVEIVDKATIPTDHWFRNAWTRAVGGGPIDIDMAKARVIQAQKIEIARRLEIDLLRNEENKARLKGQTANADRHATDRTALEAMNFGAIAASITGAANPTALRAIWPAGLPPQDSR